MNRNRLAALFVLVLVSSAAAFALRAAIYAVVVVPLAYLWWLIGLYYRLVPQVFLWVALIVMILVSAVRTLLFEIPLGRRSVRLGKAHQGPVENLTELLDKRRRGIYYKWLIANRLGKAARELLDQRDGSQGRRFTRLSGRDWDPPEALAAYLDSGVNGTFADYPRPRWSRPQPTPLDQHPGQVVAFLESELQSGRNGNR